MTTERKIGQIKAVFEIECACGTTEHLRTYDVGNARRVANEHGWRHFHETNGDGWTCPACIARSHDLVAEAKSVMGALSGAGTNESIRALKLIRHLIEGIKTVDMLPPENVWVYGEWVDSDVGSEGEVVKSYGDAKWDQWADHRQWAFSDNPHSQQSPAAAPVRWWFKWPNVTPDMTGVDECLPELE